MSRARAVRSAGHVGAAGRGGSLVALGFVAACAGADPGAAGPADSSAVSSAPREEPLSGQILVGVPANEHGPPAMKSAPPESEPPSVVPPVDAAVEQAMLSKINAYRAAHGLGPLSVRPVLADKARLWAQEMAEGVCGADKAGVPKICHSSLRDGITVSYALLAENVGRVSPPDVPLLETAFERSPSHSAEMLHPAFVFIGVGVAYYKDTMFVAEEFMAPPQRD